MSIQIPPANARHRHRHNPPSYRPPDKLNVSFTIPTVVRPWDYYRDIDTLLLLPPPPPPPPPLPETFLHPEPQTVLRTSSETESTDSAAAQWHSAAGAGPHGQSAHWNPRQYSAEGMRSRAHAPTPNIQRPGGDLSSAPPPPPQRIQNPLDPRCLGGIPSAFTARKLQEWGDVYLGNRRTADAFVRAVPIAPLELGPDPRQQQHQQQQQTGGAAVARLRQFQSGLVRVKVVPKNTDRKVFFMHKRFAACRRRLLAPQHHGVEKTVAASHGRLVATNGPGGALSGVLSSGKGVQYRQDPPLPIHIEYALYRAPLLAAILLSGHVLKGDTVEVPIPSPDIWPAVMKWVYTGRGVVTELMSESIEYIGGQL